MFRRQEFTGGLTERMYLNRKLQLLGGDPVGNERESLDKIRALVVELERSRRDEIRRLLTERKRVSINDNEIPESGR